MRRRTDWLPEAKMTNRLTLSAAVAALALGAAACSGPDQVATPAAPPTPTPAVPKAKTAPRGVDAEPLADPDSPRRIVYAPGLISDPLPARQRVTVSRADVEKKAAKRAFGAKLQPGNPEAALRLVKMGPGDARTAVGKPSWVLTWKDSVPDIKGSVQLSDQERRALAARVSCVFVLVVDAQTGADVDARQLCVPKNR